MRVIKLTSLKDEYAYLLTEDYIGLIARMRALKEVCSLAIRALKAEDSMSHGSCCLEPSVMLLDS